LAKIPSALISPKTTDLSAYDKLALEYTEAIKMCAAMTKDMLEWKQVADGLHKALIVLLYAVTRNAVTRDVYVPRSIGLEINRGGSFSLTVDTDENGWVFRLLEEIEEGEIKQ